MFESESPQKETMPCEGSDETETAEEGGEPSGQDANQLTRMQLLCVLRCLRPDKVVAAVQDYVAGQTRKH